MQNKEVIKTTVNLSKETMKKVMMKVVFSPPEMNKKLMI